MGNRKSCTQTASSVGAWWKVDLKKAFQIKSVVIWNRQDCYQNRLDQVTVSVCCSPPSLAFEACGRVAVASRKNTIRCNGVRGRYVQVMSHQPRQVKLTLCEVQVFGSECTDPDCKTPWTPSPTKPPCLDATSRRWSIISATGQAARRLQQVVNARRTVAGIMSRRCAASHARERGITGSTTRLGRHLSR